MITHDNRNFYNVVIARKNAPPEYGSPRLGLSVQRRSPILMFVPSTTCVQLSGTLDDMQICAQAFFTGRNGLNWSFGDKSACVVRRCLCCGCDPTPDLSNPAFVSVVWDTVAWPIEEFLAVYSFGSIGTRLRSVVTPKQKHSPWDATSRGYHWV